MSDSNTQQPLRIGLTGGIASGKSTVAEQFSKLGVPIIDTDIIAREVVAIGSPGIEEVRKRFGDSVIDESGNLDRAAMRKLIFLDDAARSDLEGFFTLELALKCGARQKRLAALIRSLPYPYW